MRTKPLRQARPKQHKKQRGFSLIEVLVAMMIFAGSILVINNVWSGNFFRIKKARRMNEVSLLLKQKITEYEILYTGKSLAEIPEKESGNFGEGYTNYSWSMSSREFEMPNLASAITGPESDGGGGNEMIALLTQTMSDYLNKSVKEMKVTVIVKGFSSKKKKNLEYSATTLFVDYDQELSIPGIGGLGGGAGGGTNNDGGGN